MKNRKMVVELRDKITNEFVKNVELDLTQYNLIKIKEVLGITIYRKEVR